MLGFGLFTLTEYALFPDISEYEQGLIDSYNETLSYQYPDITQNLYATIISKQLIYMFFYGMVSVAPAIMLTSIIRNKYLVLCIPFFLKYVLNQSCVKIQSQALSNYETVDMSLLKFVSVINPDALSYLSEYGSDKKLVLIYSGFIILFSFVFYLTMCIRRNDCGE